MRHHPGHRPGRRTGSSAFAEGRRLRDTAQRRRHPDGPHHPHRSHHPRWSHHPHWSGPHPPRGSGPPPWLILLVVIPAVMIAGSLLVTVMLAGLLIAGLAALAVPAVLLGGIAFAAVRTSRRRTALRRGGAPGTAPLPGRPPAVARPDLVWGRARARFHAVAAQYAAYECDAIQVLRLPALADVRVASTARFVDAFAEAQALETDAFPPGGHGAAFVAAVDRAERGWRAAREAAERIRCSGLTPAERGSVERVIKLLTTARDSDSDAERLTAYAMARAELARLDRAGAIHLPPVAKAALDTAARGALPAS